MRRRNRAATRRLIEGLATAGAIAAVCAPAAGAATVTTLDTAAPGAATYTAASGEGNHLALSFDGTQVHLADVAPIDPVAGALDGTDGCLPPAQPAAPADPAAPPAPPADQTWTCKASDLRIFLGDGDDTLTMGAGLPAATIDGGTGVDALDFARRTDPVTVRLNATPAGGMTVQNVENVTGGAANDSISGDAADNSLAGDAGDDSISGGGGADNIDGGAGSNTLRGGPGDDTLTAGPDGDVLVGGAGADTLTGGAGDDEIVAADGVPDTITCGAGTNDTVNADLGANGVTDNIVDPKNCETITGSVASVADPVPTSVTDTSVIVVPALGTPAITPVLAPGPANPADLTPPSATMRLFSRQRLVTVLVRGVPVRVTCREACGISAAVSVGRAAGRALKLDTRQTPVVIGTATAKRASAGTTQLHVKFTKRARAALKRSRKSVPATTQVLVSDASGNGMLLTRRLMFIR